MDKLFIDLLNTSITAGYLVLVVLLLRPILKKAPKYIRCILWGLVGLRLVLPFSLESITSLIPNPEPIPPEIVTSPSPTIQTGIYAFNSVVNPVLSQSMAPAPGDSVNPMQVFMGIAWNVWLLGVVALALYSIISYLLLRQKLGEAVHEDGRVWLCDRVDTPFLLGLFRPRIYLPSSLNDTDKFYVLAHENAHIRRKDHWWKPIGFLLLTVYWFNPLMWVAYIFLCRDIEFACDERVMKELGESEKKPYSEALINCSVPKKMISACPVAFGEDGVKGRIKAVLNYKKPAFWIILTAILLCIVVAFCFLTNPPKDKPDTSEYRFQAKVVEIREDSLLVEPIDRIECLSGADQVVVKLNGNDPEFYRLGCVVDILFDGVVQELYPPIVPNATSIVNMDMWSSTLPIADYSFQATVTEIHDDHIIVKYRTFPLHNLEYRFYRVNTDPTGISVGATVVISYDGRVTDAEPYPILGETCRVEVLAEGGVATDNDGIFTATVLEVREDSLLVQPHEGEFERTISDEFAVMVENPTDYSIEDSIAIYYDGIIAVDTPPVIAKVLDSYRVVTFGFDILNTQNSPSASFDVDNDGIVEACYITTNPYTGRIITYFVAFENGVLEYIEYMPDTPSRNFTFQETESGKNIIVATDPIHPDYEPITYTILAQGQNLFIYDTKAPTSGVYPVHSPVLPTLHTVKAEHPQLLNLDATNGLIVYVEENTQRCEILSGTGNTDSPTFGTLISLEETAVILSTYRIPREQVSVIYSMLVYSSRPPRPSLSTEERAQVESILFAFLPTTITAGPYMPPEFDVHKTYPVVVYAYQSGENSWRFSLYEDTTVSGPMSSAMYGFDSMDAEQAKKALSAYGLAPSEIPVIVINSYISSYYYEIDENTVAKARQALGLS